MAQAQRFSDDAVLSFDHVVVVVAGETGAHSVGRLCAGAMTDCIRQHDEMPGRIQRLAGAKQPVAEIVRQKSAAGATGSM